MKGILFVHGFVSWAKDYEFIIKQLNAEDFMIEAPHLRGHEKLRFKGVTHQDWIDDVYAAYDRLSAACDEIYLVGHSMGCILLGHLINRQKQDPKIKRVIFFNPAYKHTSFKRVLFDGAFIAFEYIFIIAREKNLKRSIKRIFTPPRIIGELYKLSKKSQDLIKEIDKDILVFGGRRDGLTRLKFVRYTYENIQHPKKELRIKKYGHVPYAASKKTRDELFVDFYEFISIGFKE